VRSSVGAASAGARAVSRSSIGRPNLIAMGWMLRGWQAA
jgi:hypothetical protein